MADLITWSTVKDELGLETSLKSKTERLISWISAKAEVIAGRKLTSETRTQYLPGNGTDTIVLPIFPVTAFTSLNVDSQHKFTGSDVSSDDYYIDMDTGIITLYNATVPRGVNVAKVVYTAGWTEATLPGDVLQACLEAITWNLQRENDRAFGIRNQTTPDGVNIGYEMVLPMGVQRVFESYANVRV